MEVSICLNFTGTTDLGPTMNAYSDVDNYSSPIGGTILVSNLVPNNCPYILTGVPDGTTKIRLVSTTSPFCCVNLIVGAFNICEVCDNLGFTDETNPSMGQLSLGFLTGSCDANISNFYLEWYGPGANSTQLQFTSGLGTSYIPPNVQHPLTGTSSPFLYAGSYRPIIKEIEINNVIYNNTYGAYGDCFKNDLFIVEPYTATNGSGIVYEHELVFEGFKGANNFGTIELSATTNYVPFRFNGGFDAETLTIYFSGSAYPNPIVLENIIIGDADDILTPLNFSTSQYPKNLDTDGFFTRILCLTGLTRNIGDILQFSVIPYDINLTTNFQFYFTQLENIGCDTCVTTSPIYKLSADSFTYTLGNCGQTILNFAVSGCSTGVDDNTDLHKYIINDSALQSGFSGYGTNGLIPLQVNLGDIDNYLCQIDAIPQTNCVGPKFFLPGVYNENLLPDRVYISTQTLGGSKIVTLTVLPFIGNTLQNNWANAYFNYLLGQYNAFMGANPLVTDPTDPNYWTNLIFYLQPTNCTGLGTNLCPTPFTPYAGNIHLSTVELLPVVPYDVTRNQYQMIITLRTPPVVTPMENYILANRSCFEGPCITTGPTLPEQSVWNILRTQAIDTFNLTPIFSLTNPLNACFAPVEFGSFPEQPFGARSGFISYVPPASNAPSLTAITSENLTIYKYQLNTYPSNLSQVLLTNLSAVTCSSLTATTYNIYSSDTTNYRSTYTRGLYNYIFEVTNAITNEYEIYATPRLSNGQFSSQQVLIATGINDNITVLEPTYFTP